MKGKLPTVVVVVRAGQEEVWLEQAEQAAGRIAVDSPAWVAWLDGMGESFAYPVFNPKHGYIEGFMTVRKEHRQRGGSYWTVYRRCGTQLHKVYVGRSTKVTTARLAEIARAFLVASEARHGAPLSRPPS